MITPIYLTQAFRPFFPLAALYAATGILVWLMGLLGILPLPTQPTLWHAHEMLFGFAAAIIAGFALTAVANWTGQQAVTPVSLAVLAGVWMTARLTALFPSSHWQLCAAIADCLFLPLLAWLMARVLLRTRNRRNYMFIPFLCGLAMVNIGFHLSLYQGSIELARLLIQLTAYLVGFLMVFMGGRVIPFFSANRCGYTPTQWPWLNWLSTLSALLAGGLLVALPATIVAAVMAAIAGMATLLRLLLWQPWRVWREPMLWILHLGYTWLAVAYLLAAAVHIGWLQQPLTLPIHALMAGGLGCLGLGMITRVALGHSGRPIKANLMMHAAFILVIFAGLLRVASYAPWAWTGLPSLTLSALMWSLAFLFYFLNFAPKLWRKNELPPAK
jgi:uncharacterized protein involved in response to NO